MNKYELEKTIKRKYPEIFGAEDFVRINAFPRSNIKWVERYEKIYDTDKTNYNYEQDKNIYYFYQDRLFAILQQESPIYPGESVFMFIEVDSIPINALVNGIHVCISKHTIYRVGVYGKNTGTYKVIKIGDEPYKYMGRGAILRLDEKPSLMTEEFVPYKRPELMGEPNSDW